MGEVVGMKVVTKEDRACERVLVELYALARDTVPASLSVVATRTGYSLAQVERALRRLDTLGLADADRVRLTLVGLASAVSSVGPHRLGHTTDECGSAAA